MRGKIERIIDAKNHGRSLTLELKSGKLFTGFPIEIMDQFAIFIDDDTKIKFRYHIGRFEIVMEGYSLEREEIVKKNLEYIKNRRSDHIEQIEFWNDNFESIYLEDLILISEDEYWIKIQENLGKKSCKIRKPFIRNISFEGQLEDELLSKDTLSEFEGYKCFDLAIAKIDDRKIEDIAPTEEAQLILRLLQKAVEDQSISQFTRASAYRIMGEIFEAQGISIKAIDYYEKAVSLYEKIGVKKRLKKLKERVVS